MPLHAFSQYIQYEKRYSKHTVKAYTKDLEQFAEYLDKEYELDSLLRVEHFHVRSWVVKLMDKDKGKANLATSIHRKLSSLKTFYKFCLREGKVSSNPMDKVLAPKTAKRLPGFIEEQSMEVLIDELSFTNDFSGQRDKAIIEVLYGTGIRRAELIGLKLEDIDQLQRTIRVTGKGNKVRLIPYNKDLQQTIEAYIQLRNEYFPLTETTNLFLTEKGKSLYPKLVYNVVTKYLGQVTTAQKRSPHILRHSFATHLSNAGADMNAIKSLLGHASLVSTQIYTHNSIEKLKKAYSQAHPRSGKKS